MNVLNWSKELANNFRSESENRDETESIGSGYKGDDDESLSYSDDGEIIAINAKIIPEFSFKGNQPVVTDNLSTKDEADDLSSDFEYTSDESLKEKNS